MKPPKRWRNSHNDWPFCLPVVSLTPWLRTRALQGYPLHQVITVSTLLFANTAGIGLPIDPWSSAVNDPWVSFNGTTAASKRAKKEETETLPHFDLAKEFGFEAAGQNAIAGATASASISPAMAISA